MTRDKISRDRQTGCRGITEGTRIVGEHGDVQIFGGRYAGACLLGKAGQVVRIMVSDNLGLEYGVYDFDTWEWIGNVKFQSTNRGPVRKSTPPPEARDR